MSDSPPFVQSMVASDVDAIEDAISGMPIQVSRLSGGPGRIHVTNASLGGLGVLSGRFGFSVSTEGELAQDTLVAAFQLEDGEGSWDGREFSLDRVWFYPPGSDHVGVGSDGPHGRPPAFATVSVPLAALDEGVAESLGPQAWTVDEPRVRRLRSCVRAVLTGGTACEEGDLIDSISALLSSTPDAPLTYRSSDWITRECIALADHGDPMPSAVELGEMLGVSDRWVRAAFNEVYGVSVSSFFRSRAIHRAHRELVRASQRSATVTDVALRSGFVHLGRFSATYRSQFGELPSQTLAR